MLYLGTCHCEAIGFTYETAMAPQAWPLRACACRFCRCHAAATTSDPQGTLQLVCTQERILKVFRITGLTKVFPIHSSVPDALGAQPA